MLAAKIANAGLNREGKIFPRTQFLNGERCGLCNDGNCGPGRETSVPAIEKGPRDLEMKSIHEAVGGDCERRDRLRAVDSFATSHAIRRPPHRLFRFPDGRSFKWRSCHPSSQIPEAVILDDDGVPIHCVQDGRNKAQLFRLAHPAMNVRQSPCRKVCRPLFECDDRLSAIASFPNFRAAEPSRRSLPLEAIEHRFVTLQYGSRQCHGGSVASLPILFALGGLRGGERQRPLF